MTTSDAQQSVTQTRHRLAWNRFAGRYFAGFGSWKKRA